MILKRDSVNITPQDLVTNAVRVLVESDSGRYSSESQVSLTKVAQGYLRAAELMHNLDMDYIDLGDRVVDRV